MEKTWSRPELIVLVKGKPEEAVLAACKTEGSSGPNVNFGACVAAIGATCGACETISSS
jgi:hypothetical protein